MERRKLTLKRDVLQELTSDDLAAVAAGGPTKQTEVSCLDYISCWWWQCLPTLDRRCVE